MSLMTLATMVLSQAAGAQAGARITVSTQLGDAAGWRAGGPTGGGAASGGRLDLFGGASDIINAATAVDAAGAEKTPGHGSIAVSLADNGMRDHVIPAPAPPPAEDYAVADIAAALTAYNDIGNRMLDKTGVTGVFAAYEPGGDASVAHVPEPSSLALLAVALVIILLLRRRRWLRV